MGKAPQEARTFVVESAAGAQGRALAIGPPFLYYRYMHKRKRAILRSIVVSLPKAPGRPATGTDPVVTLRLPQKLIDMLDSVAEAEGATRSDVMRELLEFGLNARKGKVHAKK